VSQTISVWDSTGGDCQAGFIAVLDSTNNQYTYHFFDQSTGNIATWNWNFGDPNSGASNTSTLQHPVHTFSGPGMYNICLTVQGADSTCFSTSCMTIVINLHVCHAAFTYYPDTANAGNTIHFFDLSTGDIAYWYWSFGDGTYSTENNPVHTYPGPGYYLVSLTVTSWNQSCSDQVFDTIYVSSGPDCQAYFTYASDPAVGNNTIVFTDLSTGSPSAWFWNFGDGTSGSVQNPIHTFAGPGIYNVCLTITGNNCTSTFCKDVIIQDSLNYHQIYGQVFAGNFPLSSGLAIIFSLDTTANYQPYVNVCPIDSNGIYYFTLVPDGNYYIMAIPISPGGYLPTYYGNTVMWQQATLIQLGTENNPYHISLVPAGSMTYGPGSVSGQIGMSGLKSSMLDKVNMILMNEQGSPIGFTQV
jgi:PKD repeat protein